MRKPKVHEFSYVAHSGNNIHTHDYNGEVYYDGSIITPWGFVAVYSQGLAMNAIPSSSFRFVWKGRVYVRSEDVARRPRGLSIVAGRFARKVVRAAR